MKQTIGQWSIAAVAALLVLTGCNRSESGASQSPAAADQAAVADPVTAARSALGRRQWARANQLIQEALIGRPDDPEVLELAGDLAVQAGDTLRATEHYRRAVEVSEPPSTSLIDKLGQQWMNAGRPFESLAVLQSAVARFPEDPGFRQRLVGLQAALGLELESLEHLQWLVQRGHGSLNLLIILSDLSRPQTVEATCRYALEQAPADLRPQYSLARLPAYHGKWRDVAEKLGPVVETHPDFVPAAAFLGRALVELQDTSGLASWAESLPAGIETHPQYWLAAGIRAERNGLNQQAAHAYWRAVRLNENDGEALNRLSTILAKLQRMDESKSAAQRAAAVNTLRNHVDSLISWRNNSQTAAVKIAKALDALGRLWEATAWLQEAHRMTQNVDPQLQTVYRTVRGKLTGKTPWQLPEQLVAGKLDLSSLPEIDWRVADATAALVTPRSLETRIRFTDQAAQRGLQHVCRLSKPPGQESGLAIYQSGAGGVGVIDFDLDGWPDLYVTSMDGEPMKTNSSPNRLFRNLDGRFLDQTIAAVVGDRGFAQGIAVGDYDADGFPDLLVANIGDDRLLRNNGDGTFADVTEQVGLDAAGWTTSAAIADIDGDGHADLFQVGYCAGREPLERPCIDKDLGEPRSCAPLAFAAQPDRLWQGSGTGKLTDVTASWLGDHEPGRGMGIVAGDLDAKQGLDLYIANDMTANHFWTVDNEAERFRLSEQATLRGLAFNERSLSQASMGIAVGDADNDADVDFLVTHFSGDHNTFYEQIGDGVWADRSRQVGLAAPSDRMLAYGTQWIDAENDGSFELLIANGDIDDFTHQGRFFRQPFQIFDRMADGTWQQLPRSRMSEYFQKDYLARAVAVLDADRDGRTDFVVTHLFDPVALLVNETPATGKQVRFFVKGTACHPDAIGTRIDFRAKGELRSGQLFAGDGYQCSNERCIAFGLGDAAELQDVTILWPDGSRENLGNLASDADYLVVQGAGEAFSISLATR